MIAALKSSVKIFLCKPCVNLNYYTETTQLLSNATVMQSRHRSLGPEDRVRFVPDIFLFIIQNPIECKDEFNHCFSFEEPTFSTSVILCYFLTRVILMSMFYDIYIFLKPFVDF